MKPYIAALAANVSATGVPTMRPLWFVRAGFFLLHFSRYSVVVRASMSIDCLSSTQMLQPSMMGFFVHG
jgi:hypothetical protein